MFACYYETINLSKNMLSLPKLFSIICRLFGKAFITEYQRLCNKKYKINPAKYI